MERYIINPLTSRQIKVDGPTYKKLQAQGLSLDHRGSPTRGWKKASPKRGSERHKMKRHCGDKCFLLSDAEKYPVCRRGSCDIDCRGVTSAKIRASQYQPDLLPEISRLEKRFCSK